MIIERSLLPHLVEWRSKKGRKPLILRGGRQVGKTFLVTQFGKRFFENCVVLNFEKESTVRKIFETEEDVKKIIRQIEIIKNAVIHPEKTLLFFDEIQDCPSAIGKLRYFYEEVPQVPIIAAGSLLEFVLDHEIQSFPVGRVEFLYLFPVTFEEYLSALEETQTQQFLENISPTQKIPEAIHETCRQHLRDYFLVGGMPELVAHFAESRSLKEVQSMMEALLQTAEEDFRKYRTRFNPHHLAFIFRELPKWIGKRVNLTKLGEPDLTPAQVSLGVKLLGQAMLIHRVGPVFSLKFPLHSKPRAHPKIIFLDLGLAQYLNHISQEIIVTNKLSSIYEGGLAEQFVAQELLAVLGRGGKPELNFWTSDNPKSLAEVDLIFPHEEHIIPVEIKSGQGGRLASLHQFNLLYKPPLSVRLYDGPLMQEKISVNLPTQQKISYPLLSVPLYLVSQIPRLIAQFLHQSD